MNKIIERYASAIGSANLRSKPDTTYSDSDVTGAMGLASKRNALAAALMRLFSGDNRQSAELVQILAEMAHGKAAGELKRIHATDIARSVLAWHRDGVCKPCGGHGYALIMGTKTLGEDECKACRGTGRLEFDRQFALEHLLIARWLLTEVEREQGRAGPAAMQALAPRLDL